MKSINLMILLLAFVAVSCSNDEKEQPIDGCHFGRSLLVIIQNEDGDNLLDYHVQDNVVGTLKGSATCDGKTYQLDWSIMNHDMFGVYPINFESADISHEMSESDSPWPRRPCNFPPVDFGFRYYVEEVSVPIDVSPSDYYLYIGDFLIEEDCVKTIELSFPKHDVKYSIVWEAKENGIDSVLVNGEKHEGNTVHITMPSAVK